MANVGDNGNGHRAMLSWKNWERHLTGLLVLAVVGMAGRMMYTTENTADTVTALKAEWEEFRRGLEHVQRLESERINERFRFLDKRVDDTNERFDSMERRVERLEGHPK